MMYTGFVIPLQAMVPWFRWISYINPLAYAFESLMINEFRHRTFDCNDHIPSGPSYMNLASQNHICETVGALPGGDNVSGNDYLLLNFNYRIDHLWRWV